jgi:hypothetical protein
MIDAKLANRIDVWGFENGCLVFKDLSLGMALKISALDVSCKTDDVINLTKELFRNFLNGLPPDLSLQVVQEITSGNQQVIDEHLQGISDTANQVAKELTLARAEALKALDQNGQLPTRNLYLFVRMPFKNVAAAKNGFFRKQVSLSEDELHGETERLRKMIEDIRAGLSTLQITAEPLTEAETFQLIYNQWNPDRPIAPQNLASHDLRDQIALTDIVIGIDSFKIGRVSHKVISLKLLPEQTFASMAEVLAHLPFDSKLHLSVVLVFGSAHDFFQHADLFPAQCIKIPPDFQSFYLRYHQLNQTSPPEVVR